MDTKAVTADRRSFLSAAGAIGAVSAIPAFAAINPRASWDGAIARWQAACSVSTQFDATTLARAHARYSGWFAAQGWTELPRGASFEAFKQNNERHSLLAERCPYHDEYEAALDENQRLADVESDAHSALMGMPAPDRAALRWKLDYILDGSGADSTDSYAVDFVAQTVRDYHRLLGDV